jgi:hypothetical protein
VIIDPAREPPERLPRRLPDSSDHRKRDVTGLSWAGFSWGGEKSRG